MATSTPRTGTVTTAAGDPSHPAAGQQLPGAWPYTATDSGRGNSADSLRTWQNHRELFSEFVQAQVTGAPGAAGPPYRADGHTRPVHPTLVLTDDQGRTLALNGTPCGWTGTGPLATAEILTAEGLLPAADARPVVTTSPALTLYRGTPTPNPPPGAFRLEPVALRSAELQRRWVGTCRDVDPRLPDDSHLPALVACLQRLHAAGQDIAAVLAAAATDGPLPEQHPGRALHLRLVAASPAAATPPSPTPPRRPRTEPPTTPPAPPATAAPQRPGPRL